MNGHLNPLFLPATLLGLWAWLVPALAGTAMPTQIQVDDIPLNRIEHRTIRYAGLFRVYSLGVYAAEAGQWEGLLESSGSKCIEALYHRNLERDLLAEAANRILARQHTPSVLERYAELLRQLHAHYVDVETGDRYRLCHVEGDGLRLTHNGENPLALTDEGFARLYLGIWLGPDGILGGID